jgi:hypothetical protein
LRNEGRNELLAFSNFPNNIPAFIEEELVRLRFVDFLLDQKTKYLDTFNYV